MIESIGEAIISLLEHLGDVWPNSRRKLPRRGTLLRVRTPVALSGRDLRPERESTGFVASLPSRTLVRVEDVAGEDGAGLWVRPIDDVLSLLPAECRTAAAAYGYAFEIPPGAMTQYFEIVSPAI